MFIIEKSLLKKQSFLRKKIVLTIMLTIVKKGLSLSIVNEGLSLTIVNETTNDRFVFDCSSSFSQRNDRISKGAP